MKGNEDTPVNTSLLYLKDLVFLVKEKAMQAKSDFDLADESNQEDYAYKTGYLMALHEVVSLMKDQADSFDINQNNLGLENINPESDLL
jgi:hypothetical protein